jgi:hypothetical protein
MTGVLATLAALLAAAAVTPPPANVGFDYQLGGPYPPAADAGVVVRDRLEPPAGRYDVCYVNAFQTQPGSARTWRKRHPELLLRRQGRLVEDPDWPGEYLLDTGTAAKRRALARVVGRQVDSCARAGYEAVEPDNLDSWTRSRKRLSGADNAAFATLLVARAHRRGLAIAQKNAAELLRRARAIGFDFAVVEECQPYDECDDFMAVYGDRVFELEYPDNGGVAGFEAACAARGDRISITLRDRDVVPRGEPAYLSRSC